MKELRPELHTTSEHVLVNFSGKLLEHHIVKELKARNFKIKVLVRNQKKVQKADILQSEIIEAIVTLSDTLKGKLKTVNTVISTFGISSNEKSVFDNVINYQCNKNLLQEAKSAGVKKFVFLTSISNDSNINPEILMAHKDFVALLRESEITYTIIQVNKIVSSRSNKSNKGKTIFFGKKTPQEDNIHPRNLAITIVNAVKSSCPEIFIGERKGVAERKVIKNLYMSYSKSKPRTALHKYLNPLINKFFDNIRP